MTERTYTHGTPAERQLARVLNAKGNVNYRMAELADAQATLAEAEALDPRLDEFERSILDNEAKRHRSSAISLRNHGARLIERGSTVIDNYSPNVVSQND